MTTPEHKPPVFFAIAFVILIFGLFSKFAFKGQVSTSPKPIVKDQGEEQSEKIVRTLKKMDFNRPISCAFDDNTSTVSAQMDGGTNISIVIMPKAGIVQHVLVTGDCLYRWGDDKSNKGLKKCGVGTYISMGKQFLGTGLLSSEMVENGMKEIGKTMQVNLVEVLDSCKNTQGVNGKQFNLPRGIAFQDEALPASK